ncbi:Glutelin type-B 2 [Euphorbia peplus]|nr:Glutelin type-B 2 [Euphorbia peplus]
MAYFPTLSMFLCCLHLLFLLHGCIATPNLPEPKCQMINLIPVEPDIHISSEGGSTDTWNPKSDHFQCAGVEVTRRTIKPNALYLPAYTNANKLAYILQGKGTLGLINHGCSKELKGEEKECEKIHHIQSGDLVALRAGEGVWAYNSGNETLSVLSIHYITNADGHRSFNLGGSTNILNGFSPEFITGAFNIDNDLANKLLRKKDLRGSVTYTSDGGLHYNSPCPRHDQPNFVDEFLCNVKSRTTKISDPSRADLFIPEVGYLTSIDALKLPVLESIQLSVSYELLRKDVMRLPHWENSYTITYIVKGEGHVQVVDDNGKNVFDGILKEGQIFVIPQHLVLAKRAKSETFEYVTFKTTANPITSIVSGRNSVMSGIPLEVLTNSFEIAKAEAKMVKFGRTETALAKIMPNNI